MQESSDSLHTHQDSEKSARDYHEAELLNADVDNNGAIPMPKDPAPTSKRLLSDADTDVEGIVMPRGPPPSRAPSGPRATRYRSSPSNFPPLPSGPPPAYAFPPGQRYASNLHSHARADARNTLPRPYNSTGSAPFSAARPSGVHVAAPFPHPPSLRPPPGPPPSRPSAVISAAPQLRDLKREATSFVPNALRKKRATEKATATKSGLPDVVNAAPRSDDLDDFDAYALDRIDLVASLRPHLAAQHEHTDARGDEAKQSSENDYQKFLGEIDDL